MNGFMIFIIAVIGAIAFFHYTQGFFSAVISAVICVIAAALAVSYHETVAPLLSGIVGNSAHSVALLLMFGIIYLVPRTAMDSLVPGNVTLPAALDKAGAALMGLVAGVIAAGVIALAAQEMPVGPSILGYTRFAVDSREVSVPVQPRALDRSLIDVMTVPTFDPNSGAEPQALVVPVDDFLLETVRRLSEGGSLSGQTELTKVHPNWLTELFGQRLGIEPGGKRVAKPEDGELVALYTVPSLQQKDHEFSGFARNWTGGKLPTTFPSGAAATTAPAAPARGGARAAAAPGSMIVVARVMFKRSAADKDRLIRFSPGSIRLVALKDTAQGTDWANYFPIGTLDPRTRILWRNRPDDFLFISEAAEPAGDKGVDLVFYVDRKAFVGDPKDPKSTQFAEGSFLEIKRDLRFPLGGQEILSGAAAAAKLKSTNAQIQVLRKPNVEKPPEMGFEPTPTPPPTPAPQPPAPQPPEPGTTAPSPTEPAKPPTPQNPILMDVRGVKVNSRFFTGISVVLRGGGQFAQIPGGVASAKNKELTAVELTPTDVTLLRGDIIEMFVPEGQAMVQVEADATNAPIPQSWDWWGRVGELGLKDDKGAVHKMVGAWASFDLNGTTHLTGAFQSDPANPLLMPQMSTPAARPSKIYLAAYVPKGVKITEVVMGNEALKSGVNVDVP